MLLHEVFKTNDNEQVITWVYEQGSFVPTAKLVDNESFSIVSDYIGRPIQVYDQNGDSVWSCDYDIYGKLINLQGDKSFIPFRQLGQYEDVETGLYYNRFRYYDCNTGTYISQDPIGLAGNNPNIYAYVFDSNTEVDIFGLEKIVNLLEGNLREDLVKEWLKDEFPNAEILRERYITNSQGIGVRDEVTNSRRRLDFVVIEKEKVTAIYEVTSPTANKVLQEQKEHRIRLGEGTSIKKKGKKGKIYDISEIKTVRIDVDLKKNTIKHH